MGGGSGTMGITNGITLIGSAVGPSMVDPTSPLIARICWFRASWKKFGQILTQFS
jgi:hypothetical protein